MASISGGVFPVIVQPILKYIFFKADITSAGSGFHAFPTICIEVLVFYCVASV